MTGMSDSNDIIEITGIRGRGYHGVFAHERQEGQEFSIDVSVHLSTRAAAMSDHLADTVDYGLVAEAVHELIVGQPFDLIETLAERVAEAVLEFKGAGRVVVTVHKPSAPITVPFDDVTLTIVRPP